MTLDLRSLFTCITSSTGDTSEDSFGAFSVPRLLRLQKKEIVRTLPKKGTSGVNQPTIA